MNELTEKLKKIRLIALDVDGTLTEGKIRLDSGTNDSKAFSCKDGLGLETWHRFGGISAIITGRAARVVERRAQEIGVKYVLQGSHNKKAALEELLAKENLTWENVCFVGDDLNDLGAMMKAGLSACPADAAPEVLNRVDFVSAKTGGNGAVREVVTAIMEAQGTWELAVAEYLR